MPKTISYTPPWLSRPEPGFRLFESTQGTLSSPHGGHRAARPLSNGYPNGDSKQYRGPKRTVAQRGTEVFVVADNGIRWSDLCMLKDDYEEAHKAGKVNQNEGDQRTHGKGDGDLDRDQSAGGYRLLQVSIAEPIRQISVSPNGSFLAIITSHTVHVAVLPNPSMLGQKGAKSIKLNTKMVAPTTHVLAQSPVASVLWHPCGVDGSCLVTITADAVVRLWEFNFKDPMSFDTPSLAIDLKKLAVGRSADEDFTPNTLNVNRGFSLDSVGMDVASACFGGNNSSEESPWSAMTLWVAMKEGDVYALCPLLPSKWQPSSTTLPSLSAQAVSNHASMQESAFSPMEMQQHKDQYQWISDLDGQEAFSTQEGNELLPGTEVYCRPFHPGSVPRLQGPFELSGYEYDQDLELSDIHVIAAKVDAEELMNGEDSDTDSGLGMEDDVGLSASIICLLTTAGQVYVCLDIDGVQAQWLPFQRNRLVSMFEEPSLSLLEILDTLSPDQKQEIEWPTFSPDSGSRYSFYVTHSEGVYFLSCEPWIQNLESELQSTANVGTRFRIEIITNGSGTLRERILDFQQDQGLLAHDPTAAVIFLDSDIGYFLLTAINGTPRAVILDKPDFATDEELKIQTTYQLPEESSMLTVAPTRQPYVPPASLWEKSTLPYFVSSHVQNRHKKALKEEIRLSAVTLDLMTRAHRVLSEETHTLGVAAADLFRRCERLQDELRDQIGRVKEAAQRTEEIVGDESEKGPGAENPKALVEKRLNDAQTRQAKIIARFEDVSRKFRKRNCEQPMNDQEQAYAAELGKINRSVMGPDKKQNGGDGQRSSEIWNRFDEANRLATDMLFRAKDIAGNMKTGDSSNIKVPPDFRKEKVGQVMDLLERESALVDAAQARLERLSLATFS